MIKFGNSILLMALIQFLLTLILTLVRILPFLILHETNSTQWSNAVHVLMIIDVGIEGLTWGLLYLRLREFSIKPDRNMNCTKLKYLAITNVILLVGAFLTFILIFSFTPSHLYLYDSYRTMNILHVIIWISKFFFWFILLQNPKNLTRFVKIILLVIVGISIVPEIGYLFTSIYY